MNNGTKGFDSRFIWTRDCQIPYQVIDMLAKLSGGDRHAGLLGNLYIWKLYCVCGKLNTVQSFRCLLNKACFASVNV